MTCSDQILEDATLVPSPVGMPPLICLLSTALNEGGRWLQGMENADGRHLQLRSRETVIFPTQNNFSPIVVPLLLPRCFPESSLALTMIRAAQLWVQWGLKGTWSPFQPGNCELGIKQESRYRDKHLVRFSFLFFFFFLFSFLYVGNSGDHAQKLWEVMGDTGDAEGCFHDWTVSPQNAHVEALTLSVTVSKDGTFKEVNKAKWGHKGGTLIC